MRELFLGEMEGQLAGAVAAAAVGEAALGPEEAGAMEIVVRRPQGHTQKRQSVSRERRRQRRRRDRMD